VITDRDIARWRLHSQLLAAPVDGAEEVVRSLLAVQAENPSQSAWAVATRTTSPRQGDLADAIGDGRVLRTHVLRPTWHYVHADDAQWLLELTAPRVLPTVDQQLRPLDDRMTALTDTVEAILAESSDRTRADLSGALADRGVELTGQQLMLLLAHLELHRVLCSGVPRDGEHTYATVTRPSQNSPCATSPHTVRPPGATSRTGPPSP
jgi:nicotinamidase-related amidase